MSASYPFDHALMPASYASAIPQCQHPIPLPASYASTTIPMPGSYPFDHALMPASCASTTPQYQDPIPLPASYASTTSQCQHPIHLPASYASTTPQCQYLILLTMCPMPISYPLGQLYNNHLTLTSSFEGLGSISGLNHTDRWKVQN